MSDGGWQADAAAVTHRDLVVHKRPGLDMAAQQRQQDQHRQHRLEHGVGSDRRHEGQQEAAEEEHALPPLVPGVVAVAHEPEALHEGLVVQAAQAARARHAVEEEARQAEQDRADVDAGHTHHPDVLRAPTAHRGREDHEYPVGLLRAAEHLRNGNWGAFDGGGVVRRWRLSGSRPGPTTVGGQPAAAGRDNSRWVREAVGAEPFGDRPREAWECCSGGTGT